MRSMKLEQGCDLSPSANPPVELLRRGLVRGQAIVIATSLGGRWTLLYHICGTVMSRPSSRQPRTSGGEEEKEGGGGGGGGGDRVEPLLARLKTSFHM